MNRETYLKELRKYLKRLPKDDYENAMEYFTEYFDDAGNDEEAIRELGSPREAASDLLAALLNQKTGDASSPTFSDASDARADGDGRRGRRFRAGDPVPEAKEKSSPLSILLIACLAICAAPIAAPLALAALVLLMCGVVVVLCAVLCIFIFSVCFVIAGAYSLVQGFAVASASVPAFLIISGSSLLAIGLGVLLFVAGIFFCKWLVIRLAKLIQRMLEKRRVKKDE